MANKFSMDKFLNSIHNAKTINADDEYLTLKLKSIIEMAVEVSYMNSELLGGLTIEELDIALKEVESYSVGASSPSHLLNEMLQVQQSANNLKSITVKQTNNGLDFF